MGERGRARGGRTARRMRANPSNRRLLRYHLPMRILCSTCGAHHEVVRVLDDGAGDDARDVYQVAPLQGCERSWFSEKDVLEAQARFGTEDVVLLDDEPE